MLATAAAEQAGNQGWLQLFGSNGSAYLCRQTVLEQKCFQTLE
jgi:hypothetical protein